jgi:hypothetical protein
MPSLIPAIEAMTMVELGRIPLWRLVVWAEPDAIPAPGDCKGSIPQSEDSGDSREPN